MYGLDPGRDYEISLDVVRSEEGEEEGGEERTGRESVRVGTTTEETQTQTLGEFFCLEACVEAAKGKERELIVSMYVRFTLQKQERPIPTKYGRALP